MATPGKLSGTIWKISVGGTSINNLTTTSASFTNETRDTTTKDSGGYREFLSTIKTATFSAEGLVALDATYGLDELWIAYDAQTAVAIIYTTAETGDIQFAQSAIITQLDSSAADNDNTTFSLSLQGTGAVTKSAVS